MDRIPETELMLDPKQAVAYANADFAEPHDRFVALLRERLSGLASTGCALDLGCGPGDVTRRFARAFPGWSVDAVDGSAPMLDLGRSATANTGLDDRIRYHELRLPSEAEWPSRFGLVFSNSLLHHLADPLVLWSSVARWAEPGAHVFVMDLMRPSSRDEAARMIDRYAADAPEVLRNDFYNSLLAAYRTGEVSTQIRASGLGALTVELVSDRHWIAWGRVN
jgi:SAM-dependent methyltransferase